MRRVLLFLVLVLLALYALTGVVQVRPGERAVVRRFGRVLAYKPEPGLWVGLPWGMDRVDRVVVDQVRSVNVGVPFDREDTDPESIPPGQLLTGDHNLVNVQVVLFYKVDPDEAADFITQSDRVDALLAKAVESATACWVAGRNVDDVLLGGKNLLRRDLIARVAETVEPYRLGVRVLDARVALIAPPDEVKDAFDNVARAQTQIATRKHGAEQEAARRVRQARAEVYRLEQEAAAYAHNRKLLAARDAERFLVRLRQYEKGRQHNPDYLRQIWEEERSRIFAKLKAGGQIDLLDHHLGPDGLDLFVAPGRAGPGEP